MFEQETYEGILKRMLDNVPDNVDKREGSVIYDALAPAAFEMFNMYVALEAVLMESFADTASLQYLERRAAERGLTRYPATSAVLKAVTTPVTVEVPLESRFSLNELNYIVTEKIADGEYKLECESAGADGNTYFGDLIPIDYIDGLQSIKITEVLVHGEDAESEEALRERYLSNVSSQAFGGNIEDYRQRVRAVKGVGGVKVTRTPNKGGEVTLTISNSDYGIPSDELITLVQNEVDPIENQGEGLGLAPIGHVVTVEKAEKVTVNITADITYADDWSWDECSTYIKKAVDNYLLELAKTWDETNDTNLTVIISQMMSDILQVEGVVDVSGVKLNGNAANLILNKYQIPVGGTINGKTFD